MVEHEPTTFSYLCTAGFRTHETVEFVNKLCISHKNYTKHLLFFTSAILMSSELSWTLYRLSYCWKPLTVTNLMAVSIFSLFGPTSCPVLSGSSKQMVTKLAGFCGFVSQLTASLTLECAEEDVRRKNNLDNSYLFRNFNTVRKFATKDSYMSTAKLKTSTCSARYRVQSVA